MTPDPDSSKVAYQRRRSPCTSIDCASCGSGGGRRRRSRPNGQQRARPSVDGSLSRAGLAALKRRDRPDRSGCHRRDLLLARDEPLASAYTRRASRGFHASAVRSAGPAGAGPASAPLAARCGEDGRQRGDARGNAEAGRSPLPSHDQLGSHPWRRLAAAPATEVVGRDVRDRSAPLATLRSERLDGGKQSPAECSGFASRETGGLRP
jgi:hypothetical protein